MSFDWLGMFRDGQWKDFRRFVLEERRDAGNRLAVIRSELQRIGYILVSYEEQEADDDGNIEVSELVTGFSVPPGTSLGKLVQAYVAAGGNPLSISHFLIPNMTVSSDGETVTQTYPSGGVIYPVTGDMTASQYDGGFQSNDGDPAKRTGGRKRHDMKRVSFHVDHSRRWVSKEIREKRNNIESRIIKLMDLKEQLEQEVTQILMAVGGTVVNVPAVDRAQFEAVFNVTSLINFLDAVFWEGEDGELDITNESENLAHYPFLMLDVDTEANHEL